MQNKISVIEVHLGSANHARTRDFRLMHCIMVSWLIHNFEKIKSGEVTYQDYDKKGSELGIATYIEESFEVFKSQERF